jgi:hypothetical protein
MTATAAAPAFEGQERARMERVRMERARMVVDEQIG